MNSGIFMTKGEKNKIDSNFVASKRLYYALFSCGSTTPIAMN